MVGLGSDGARSHLSLAFSTRRDGNFNASGLSRRASLHLGEVLPPFSTSAWQLRALLLVPRQCPSVGSNQTGFKQFLPCPFLKDTILWDSCLFKEKKKKRKKKERKKAEVGKPQGLCDDITQLHSGLSRRLVTSRVELTEDDFMNGSWSISYNFLKMWRCYGKSVCEDLPASQLDPPTQPGATVRNSNHYADRTSSRARGHASRSFSYEHVGIFLGYFRLDLRSRHVSGHMIARRGCRASGSCTRAPHAQIVLALALEASPEPWTSLNHGSHNDTKLRPSPCQYIATYRV